MVSIGAIADEDPIEARHQSISSAMAMLRMFQRKPFALLPPDEVAAFQGNIQERQVIEQYTNQTLHGTAAEVAKGLESLQRQTGTDEIILFFQGYPRFAQSHTLELITDYHGMPINWLFDGSSNEKHRLSISQQDYALAYYLLPSYR